MDPIKKDIWFSMINSKLNKTSKIYARKCTIKEVNTKEARIFIDANHMQGYANSKIKIGLYYEDELISIMTFGKPRFNKKYEWELIKFCSKINFTIIGGGSKILKYFERMHNPSSLLSYANRRWSTGIFYETVGFKLVNKTKPNPWYFKDDYKLYHRTSFQKHIVSNYKQYDKNKTTLENIFNEGYRVIYDCGNLVYVKEYEDSSSY